jgi:DNA-binding XRE family transcriptional regulator
MARSFEDIMNSLPPERQQIINQGIEQLVAEEMTLQELRKAHDYSQKVLASTLEVNQATISKMERQADMLVSTLRSFVEAMGGTLEIIATFPNHPPVRLNQFEELEETDNVTEYEDDGTLGLETELIGMQPLKNL